MIEVMLTEADLERLKKCRKIGQGKEGQIYKVSRDLIYKMYYKLSPSEREVKVQVPLKEFEIDEDGVKRIKDNSNKRIIVEKKVVLKPYYKDKDGTRKIYSIDQIEEAVKRQPKVKETSLPLGPIYINNRLGGVVYKYHKGYYDLHIIKMLPLNSRIKILEVVLEKLKELCDNNIYPIDYACQSKGKNAHSNILINIKGDVQFIDLEGRSTTYTNEFSEYYNSAAYSEFFLLFLNIMYDEEELDELEEEDFLYLEERLKRKGFNEECFIYLRNTNNLNYEISKGLIDNYYLQKKEHKSKGRF